MLNIITDGYVLPFINKPNLTRQPLIQLPSKGPSPGHFYPVSPDQERNRKGRKKVRSLAFYSCLNRKQASHRPKDIKLFECGKIQNGTPGSIRASDSRRVSSIDLQTPQRRVCGSLTSLKFTSSPLPFELGRAPQVFTILVKEVKLVALSRGIGLHQYLDNWPIKAQSQTLGGGGGGDNQPGKVWIDIHSGVFLL